MAREAILKGNYNNTESVKYNNAAAAAAGEVIFVAGIGVMVAQNAYDASADGEYYVKGIFQFDLTAGVTASQGDKIYFDKSANTAILSSSTSLTEEDFYLGRAVSNGTASGGYVDVEINNNKIDALASGKLLPASVVILAGLQTCVNFTLVTNATLETILATTIVLATDNAVVGLADVPTETTARVMWAKCNAGSITVGLNTPVKGSAPTERLSYVVTRTI